MPDWTYIYDHIEVLDIEPPEDINIGPIIDRIWTEVKNHRVLYKWATITTVADKGVYDIPTEDIDGNDMSDGDVSEVFWQVRDVSINPLNVLTDTEVWDVIRDVRITSALESLDGSGWKIIDDKIYLTPTPSASGTEVVVLMYRPRTDDEITDGDRKAVLEGILWILYERICTKITSGSSFRAGSYAATASPSSVTHLKSRADYHRDQYKMLLEDNEGVVSV